jgi:phospholipase/carboxylesterase
MEKMKPQMTQIAQIARSAGHGNAFAGKGDPMRYRLATSLLLAVLVGYAAAIAAAEGFYAEARILRPVYTRVPATGEGAPPPLVVGLHGRGGTAEEFVKVWEMFRKPKPIFAVPEAPYPVILGGGAAQVGWSWDFPSQDRRLWAVADPLVAGYILDVVRETQKKKRSGGVYLLAHSQGVSYAYLAMAQEPDLVKGVIAFAGILPEETLPDDALQKAARRVKVFIAHGKKDRALDLKVSQKAKERLEKLGFSVTYREFDGGHTVPEGVLREAQAWIEATEKSGK